LDAGDAEEDELSPNRDEIARSAEKAKRVVGTVSPIREEQDNGLDELSVLEQGANDERETVFARSTVINRTPPQTALQNRTPSGSAAQKTPATGANKGTSAKSRRSISRRSKSTDPAPATPNLLPSRQPRNSASKIDANINTPAAAAASVEDDSEDELSPQAPIATPRVIASETQPQQTSQDEQETTIDELSPQVQPTPSKKTATILEPVKEQEMNGGPGEQVKRGHGRLRQADEHHADNEAPSADQATSTRHTRPHNEAKARESELQETPSTRKSIRNQRKESTVEAGDEAGDEVIDDLSPAHGKASARPAQPVRQQGNVEVSNLQEASVGEEDAVPEEEAERVPRPVVERSSPKQARRIKPSTEHPPRKRQKLLGPTHNISVMRIKGSTVRGITAADITRSILEDSIDHRLRRMAEKLQDLQDSDGRRELRSQINIAITFKESLNEKLMDLQDANDVLSTNFQKTKLLRRANADLRKEMLDLQNSRQEIAMEQDDIQAQYHTEKAKVDALNTLNDNMFAIEAAVKNGRAKARKEGRENEGPDMPLSMLLDDVAKGVGSRGGGLLATVKGFNGLLERAAGWLEGRA
jgi:hypothetical protein